MWSVGNSGICSHPLSRRCFCILSRYVHIAMKQLFPLTKSRSMSCLKRGWGRRRRNLAWVVCSGQWYMGICACKYTCIWSFPCLLLCNIWWRFVFPVGALQWTLPQGFHHGIWRTDFVHTGHPPTTYFPALHVSHGHLFCMKCLWKARRYSVNHVNSLQSEANKYSNCMLE